MKVEFDGHWGTGDYDGSVNFYGIDFESITDAIKFLKLLKPGEYTLWTYMSEKGLVDENGQVCIDDRWLSDKNFAERYVKNKNRS